MKSVLFSVLGLSPQILTETLFALNNEHALPDEVHVLTTQRGASLCKKSLFQENGGWFYRFCQDWKVSGIKFDESHIHTTKDACGVSISDIRSNEDNEMIANQIVEFVRQFTMDSDTALHVSIAGGRKTMGVYASAALSMFGREQDRLSHVLVSEEFEGHPTFFYPTPSSQVIRTQDGKELIDTSDATVELAYLPFLTMRNVIPDHFIKEPLSYGDMVKRLQKRVFDKKVLISVDDYVLHIADESIFLSKVNFAFYYWFMKRLKERQESLVNPYPDEPDMEYGKAFLAVLKELSNEMDDDDRTIDAMDKGMSFEFIRDRRNSIKRSLIAALGALNAEDFILRYERQSREITANLYPHQIEFV